MSLETRAVVVTRTSEFDELVGRHGTRSAAEFFLASRGASIEELEETHHRQHAARLAVLTALPSEWRRTEVERADLDRFLFGPDDVVFVVGRDGLVANAAKYLEGQSVIGIDPEPGRGRGVLIRHSSDEVADLISWSREEAAGGRLTMVEATSDDGQTLVALNELYLGHRGHQSSLYRLDLGGGSSEDQSSSGLLVGTGTGATGWLASVHTERSSGLDLPRPTERALAWFVREAWPSPTTEVSLTEGILGAGDRLTVKIRSESLVCFGDGIETDALTLSWGQSLSVGVSERTLYLI